MYIHNDEEAQDGRGRWLRHCVAHFNVRNATQREWVRASWPPPGLCCIPSASAHNGFESSFERFMDLWDLNFQFFSLQIHLPSAEESTNIRIDDST